MRRDRLTFGMMIGVPLMQLVLFGFAINSDPKHLPAAVLLADHGPHGRTLPARDPEQRLLRFRPRGADRGRGARRAGPRRGASSSSPSPRISRRDLLRGDRPALLVEADATDPAATSNAIGSLRDARSTRLAQRPQGPARAALPRRDGPVDLRVHARYNPEAITQYNIVPGLMGVVLTMTMVMITGAGDHARARARHDGKPALHADPAARGDARQDRAVHLRRLRPGRADPARAARSCSTCRWSGSLGLLLAVALVFIVANLAVGITFSTVAQNQLQAMQMSFFFFLPSMLLSGFMFPFRGMPPWAQMIGEVFPCTHFLRIVRGILLKGNGLEEIRLQLWPIALFAVVALTIGVKRYRQTLD